MLIAFVIFIAVKSEGIGLVLIQAVCIFIGSLLMGLILRIARRAKKKNASESEEKE